MKGIQVTSYMTLVYGKVLKDSVLAQIADKHRATVALAWALQLGYAVIPSSAKRENLAGNLLARDLKLDADDMALIATLERGRPLGSGAAPGLIGRRPETPACDWLGQVACAGLGP